MSSSSSSSSSDELQEMALSEKEASHPQPATSRGTRRSDRSATPIKKMKIRHEAPKQTVYQQKFKVEWLENPQFKGWLAAHQTNKFLCLCKSCNAELKCGKSELEKHLSTARHKKNSAKIRGLQPVSTFFKENTIHKQKVSEAEIKLVNLLAHHNVAYNVAEHLVPVLKQCFPDSGILRDVQLGRTKTISIIKNVIAQKETEDLSKELQKKYFSILIDESTDIALKKQLCIVVKYVNDSGKICDKLLELVTVDARDCSAENLFTAFCNSLRAKDIPIENVIGLASDNANVMMGKHNSFMTRLQSASKALIILPCICHSSALVASNACSKLSRTPEEFLRSLASYFSVSAKRSAQLAEMQNFFLGEQKKMLKLSVTRWLCMQHVVNRVLENWDVLIEFFRVETFEDNSKVVAFIFEELNNKSTKAVLLFLNHILQYFNTFNALFQGKKMLIHQLSTECKKIFKNITIHFIKPELVNDFNINCRNPRLFLDLNEIDLGTECNAYLETLPDNIQTSIRKLCLEFLITASQDIQKRFPLTDEFLDALNFLKPEIAMAINKPDNLKSLKIVWSKFKTLNEIVPNKIDLQWKKIAIHFSSHKDENMQKLENVEDFWHYLKEYKNFQDEREFVDVAALANLCMSLPHSNAETERVFSAVTDIKTKKRNKLSSEALNSICVTRFSSQDCCQNFNISNRHLNLMATSNLYKK